MNNFILTQQQFNNHVLKICRDIAISGWKPDYVIGITRGGLLPAVMISHFFDIPCETLKIQLRDGTTNESNCWMAEDAVGYIDQPKNILIVDDINDTGATLNWLMKDWQDTCLPNSPKWKEIWNNNVKFAVIADNVASKCDVKMDFAAMEIDKSKIDLWIHFPYESFWKFAQ